MYHVNFFLFGPCWCPTGATGASVTWETVALMFLSLFWFSVLWTIPVVVLVSDTVIPVVFPLIFIILVTWVLWEFYPIMFSIVNPTRVIRSLILVITAIFPSAIPLAVMMVYVAVVVMLSLVVVAVISIFVLTIPFIYFSIVLLFYFPWVTHTIFQGE